ncbi:hypothetical protein BDB00DRAFT_515932 [Zychaea mexicana]|uniref:uncharacterized protein n=1 Tax=Zychaea mexicana TaxID=64656 RepID=UPI0022FF3A9E|nr:uncharacterized protein BDB00DRAFT_515932 [Zychaea mexicana]KAI9491149.1 hypothetical protein BDB00DRAFT_515932 [Zychaea mexicana]
MSETDKPLSYALCALLMYPIALAYIACRWLIAATFPFFSFLLLPSLSASSGFLSLLLPATFSLFLPLGEYRCRETRPAMGLNEAGARELAVVAAPAVVVPAPVHVVQLDELSVQSMALRKNDAQPSGADASLPVSPSLPPAVDILPAVPNGIDVPSFAVVDEAPIDQVVRNPSPVTLPSSASLDQLPSQLPVAGDFAAEDHGVVGSLDEQASVPVVSVRSVRRQPRHRHHQHLRRQHPVSSSFRAPHHHHHRDHQIRHHRHHYLPLVAPSVPSAPVSVSAPVPVPVPVSLVNTAAINAAANNTPSSTPPPSPPQPHSPCILPRTSSSHPPP